MRQKEKVKLQVILDNISIGTVIHSIYLYLKLIRMHLLVNFLKSRLARCTESQTREIFVCSTKVATIDGPSIRAL